MYKTRLGTARDGYTKSAYNLTIAFGAICAMCLIVALLFTSMQYVCYHDYSLYQEEYERYNVLANLPEGVKMTGENSLMSVTEHMMKYLIGDKDTPDLQTPIDTAEGTRDFFVERELLHMADCRVLFKKALQIRYLCVMVAIFLFIYGRYAIIREKKPFLRAFSKGMLIGAAAFFLIMGGIALYMLLDFDEAFVNFHLIFFDNDLWLLDPRESLLINILPEDFFFDIVKKTLVLFLPGTAIIVGAAAVLNKKYKTAELSFRE